MIKLSKKQVGFGILAIAGVLLSVLISVISHSLPSQHGAKRYSGDGEKYAQISAFYTSEATINETNINNYRSSFQKSLEEASIKSKYADARLWIDCYSGKIKTKVTKDNSTVDVSMIGVGGDFFMLHPVTMIKGYYFSNNEVTKDRVLIDKDVSWKLFGSTDVVGLSIQVGSKTCLVAGVFELPKDKAYKNAVGKTPIIIAPFEFLNQTDGEGAKINCYEVVLPNPVSGFAKQMALKNIAGVDLSTKAGSETDVEELNVQILENTNRFSLVRLIQVGKNFGTRTMHKNLIEYPFWENVARAKEDLAVILLLVAFLLLLFPAIAVLRWGWRRFKRRKWTMKRLIQFIQEKMEEKKKKNWEERKHEKR